LAPEHVLDVLQRLHFVLQISFIDLFSTLAPELKSLGRSLKQGGLEVLFKELGSDCQDEVFQPLLVKQYLTVRKSRLNSLFKGVDDVDFLTSCEEYKGNFGVLKHVEYFVKHHLFGALNVKVDIL